MKKILIIEDNQQNMYLISFILKKHGYNVIKAFTGQEGIQKAMENHPDLIIMDYQLPDKDGIQVTKEIRKQKGFEEIPIVFCSSNVLKGDREKAFSVGANEYLEKPIIPEEFIKEINKFF